MLRRNFLSYLPASLVALLPLKKPAPQKDDNGFLAWLESINPNIEWNTSSLVTLEKQLVGNIKESGSINIVEIYNRFNQNKSSEMVYVTHGRDEIFGIIDGYIVYKKVTLFAFGIISEIWYNSEGQIHRDGDLPAGIDYDISNKQVIAERYYLNGLIHREGRPACLNYKHGYKVWYKQGQGIRTEDMKMANGVYCG